MTPSPRPPVHVLLYRSVASSGLTVRDVVNIFTSSKRENAARDVTGLLLYTGVALSSDNAPRQRGVDEFVQWLEGPEAAVGALYARISQDPRHRDCEVLVEGPSAGLTGADDRLFPDWSMQFGRVPTLPVSVAGLRRAADRLRRAGGDDRSDDPQQPAGPAAGGHPRGARP